MSPLRAVLFDLDGTLVDSAPDLAAAANEMLAARQRAAVPFERLRSVGGSGARGMLGVAFHLAPGHEGYEEMKQEFLDRYEARMLEQTRIFDGIPPVLSALQKAGLAWGIVTNKAERFALPLCRALGLSDHAGVIVGGDTTPFTKPHPEPLLEAARRMQLEPAQCVYVGDDERDITAGIAAGMQTAAVSWGYLGTGKRIEAWGADSVLSSPQELLKLLRLA